jgi:hypothetical protein
MHGPLALDPGRDAFANAVIRHITTKILQSRAGEVGSPEVVHQTKKIGKHIGRTLRDSGQRECLSTDEY